jgi:hypothetical protein
MSNIQLTDDNLPAAVNGICQAFRLSNVNAMKAVFGV